MARSIDFSLNDEDYERLRKFVTVGSAMAKEIKRAEVLLFLHNGLNAIEISGIFGTSIAMVHRTRKNYIKGGIKQAVYDSERSGRPQKFSPAQRAKITALACTEPPEGYAKWSLSLLSDKIVELKLVESISKAQMGRILKKTK